MHAYIHTNILIYIVTVHINMYIHKQKHEYTCINTYTYIHTYIGRGHTRSGASHRAPKF